jgi:hypothetical protein
LAGPALAVPEAVVFAGAPVSVTVPAVTLTLDLALLFSLMDIGPP